VHPSAKRLGLSKAQGGSNTLSTAHHGLSQNDPWMGHTCNIKSAGICWLGTDLEKGEYSKCDLEHQLQKDPILNAPSEKKSRKPGSSNDANSDEAQVSSDKPAVEEP
jgi:hypothetical protein